jgi:DNA-binding winged helix-turn-helix (wHTH) protein
MLSTSHILTFGDFRFDASTRELSRSADTGASKPIPLGSRAAELLLLFLRRPGDLVTKNEIMDAVWPNTAVEESNLPVQISALRRALGDSGGTSSIQTVPGRGYRFTLRVTNGDETVDVAEPGLARRETSISGGSKSEGCTSDARAASAPAAGPLSNLAQSTRAPASAPQIGAVARHLGAIGRVAGWRLLGAGMVMGFLAAAVALTSSRGYVSSEPHRPAWAAATQPQAASSQPQLDLSGIWRGNDGGSYSISQSGDQVTWEGVSGDGGAKWTHTFKGAIHDNQIFGRYFDHPPGRSQNAGELTLEMVDKDRFERVSVVGRFLGSVWTRTPSAAAKP